jgi:hypothetical protein
MPSIEERRTGESVISRGGRKERGELPVVSRGGRKERGELPVISKGGCSPGYIGVDV